MTRLTPSIISILLLMSVAAYAQAPQVTTNGIKDRAVTLPKLDSSGTPSAISALTGGDGTVGSWQPWSILVDSSDTTGGYLTSKLLAGTNISLTVGSSGADETLTVTSTGFTPGSPTVADGIDLTQNTGVSPNIITGEIYYHGLPSSSGGYLFYVEKSTDEGSTWAQANYFPGDAFTDLLASGTVRYRAHIMGMNGTDPVPGTTTMYVVGGSTPVADLTYVAPTTYGTGSVTSVAFTGDGTVFNTAVSGSPITSSGTFAPSLMTQTANRVLAGPSSGVAAVPTFRALVPADMPSSGAGSGTVTSVSSGNLSPLFSTSVATSTTTPVLSFALSNAAAGSWFGNPTGSSAAPAFNTSVIPSPLLGSGGTNTSGQYLGSDGAFHAYSSGGSVTLAGDVTGASTATTVGKIQGNPVATGTLTNQQQYVASGSTLTAMVRPNLPSVRVADTSNATVTYTPASGGTAFVTVSGAGQTTPSNSNGTYYQASGTDSFGNAYYSDTAVSPPWYVYYYSPGGYWCISVSLDVYGGSAYYVASGSAGTVPTSGWGSAGGGGMSPNPTVGYTAGGTPAVSPTATIDGAALSAGDRILLTGQTTPSQNGIWIYNGTTTSYSRPTDYASGVSVPPGSFLDCYSGSAYANTLWALSGTSSVVVDTSSTTWIHQTATTYTGTSPIVVSGSTISASAATTGAQGVVQVGSGLSVSSGVVSEAQPITTIGSGLSLTSGTLSATGGTGSGTVNSGASGQVAYYPASGTAVSGESTLTASQMPALTGDVTSSAGAVATTVGKIQGNAVASGALTNQQEYVSNGSTLNPTVKSDLPSVKAVATTNAVIAYSTGSASVTVSGSTVSPYSVNGTYPKSGSVDGYGNYYYSMSVSGGPTYYIYFYPSGSYWILYTSLDSAPGGSMYYYNTTGSAGTFPTTGWNVGPAGSGTATFTYSAGGSTPTSSADGYMFASGDRILLTAQTTTSQNGPWIYTGATSSMTRPTDYATGASAQPGTFVEAAGGTAYARTFWGLTGASPATVDTTATTWSQFAPGAVTLAGDVTGTSAASTVAKIQGTTVSATAPTTGQVLTYNGTNWVPAATSGGGSGINKPIDSSNSVLSSWLLNENRGLTATDSIGSNTLTFAGTFGPTAGRRVWDGFGKGAVFNTSSGMYTNTTLTGLTATTTGMSVEAYLYIPGYSGSNIIPFSIADATGHELAIYCNSTNQFVLHSENTSGTAYESTDGVGGRFGFYHLVITLTTAGVATLYVDGASSTSVSLGAGSVPTYNRLILGGAPGGTGVNSTPYGGTIYYFRLYNSVLTAMSILSRWTATGG